MAPGTSNPDFDPATGDYVNYDSAYGSAYDGSNASIAQGSPSIQPVAPERAASSGSGQSGPTWGGSAPSASGGGSGAPSSSTPSGADWNALPQEYRNELTDIEHQWEVDTGFLMQVPPDQLLAMAKAGVLTESDFGQYMAKQMTADQQKQIPWGMFGMTKDNYVATLNGYAQTFRELTGQDLNLTPGGAGSGTGTSSDFSYISQFLNKAMTASQFGSALQQDQTLQKTYGWIKYGYNFQQFSQYKNDQTRYLGTTMSDSQALLQLQYRHTNAGSSMSAVAYSPLPGVPSPKTLSLEGSVAR